MKFPDFRTVVMICLTAIAIAFLFCRCCHEDFVYQKQMIEIRKELEK